MMAGGVLLVAAAVRLPSELRTDEAAAPVSTELCVGRPCRANDDPRPVRGYEAPSIAVDQQDPLHQVVADVNLVGTRCSWHVTFDGGKTWADNEFTIPPEFAKCKLDSNGFINIGNVVMGGGGNLYVALSSPRIGAPAPRAADEGDEDIGESVLLASSTDGGRTFGPAREILAGRPDRSFVRPALSVAPGPDGGDRLFLTVWGCNDGRCTEGHLLRSEDAGATFSEPLLFTPDPGGNSPSQPVVAADGSVYVTFLRRYPNSEAELLVARSGDDGQRFDSGVIDKQNNLGLRYEPAKIAVDPTRGWIYLVFTDTRDGPSRVFFRRSKDQGRTWERVVRLHTTGGGRSYSPSFSVAPNGRIDVVFYRRGAGEKDDVHATYSTDGGSTFAKDEAINDVPIDRKIGYWNEVGEFYAPTVASTAASAHFAWSDTRDGTPVTNTQEIFTRRIDRTEAPAA